MNSILSDEALQSIRIGLLEAVQQSYQIGIRNPRRDEKLRPLHGYIADTIKGLFNRDLNIYSLYPPLPEVERDYTNKEAVVAGAYYDKRVDIAIYNRREEDKPDLIVAVKFVLSNYRQNAINYFENSIGESANLQMNGTPVLHFFCLPNPVPYKKRGGFVKNLESISDHHISKYRKLMNEAGDNQKHIPHGFCINIFELCIDSEGGIPESRINGYQNIDNLNLSQENRRFLTEKASLKGFFELVIQIIGREGDQE